MCENRHERNCAFSGMSPAEIAARAYNFTVLLYALRELKATTHP